MSHAAGTPIRADDDPGPAASYDRRRPDETLLYRVLQAHWHPFLADLEARSDGAGTPLPRFIVEEIEAYLRCGILAHGFLRVRCEECGDSRLVGLSCKRRGFCPSCIGRRMSDTAAHLVDQVLPQVPIRQWVLTVPHALRFKLAFDPTLTGRVLGCLVRAISNWLRRRARRQGITGTVKTGAVTVIQRFDSALGLNVHFHTMFFDGVYSRQGTGKLVFHPTAAPRDEEVAAAVTRVLQTVLNDVDPDAAPAGSEEPTLSSIAQASIGLRVATGPRRGLAVRRKGQSQNPRRTVVYRITGKRCAQIEGFNLHANTRIAANDRTGLENLCRYLGRPPLSADRLAETGDGNLSLKLKRPWSDGTTHLILSPTELIEKLIPLVPRPRAHLTRYHGVLAPSAGWRALVVPAAHTVDTPAAAVSSPEDQNRVPSNAPRRGRWTPWAALLKRVFLLDVLVCPKCSGRMRILAAILEKNSIQAILGHCGLPTGPPPMTRVRGRLSPEFPGDPQDFFADPPAPDEG